MRVLVTGAGGFVGRAVIARLRRDGEHEVIGAVRRADGLHVEDVRTVAVGDIGPGTDWRAALARVDAVIHLAARVHMMHDASADPLAAYREVNRDGTLALARAAADAGVRRFVFVSSIKVNGEGGRFSERDAPAPLDPYGVSKHEAEVGLRRIAADTGLEVAIVRPPLVYGPGVRANFRALMRAVERGIPLPFGRIANRRSLVAVGNLADFLVLCATHPRAANETFLVSDGDDLSTPELVRRIARAMGRPPRLLPVPSSLLGMVARLAGRSAAWSRLSGSLQLDILKARTVLGWTPPLSVDEAMRETAAARS